MLDWVFGNPSVPQLSPQMALVVLGWVLFGIWTVWTMRNKGFLAPLNVGWTVTVGILVFSTVITWVVWDWMPRQVTSRMSTAAGWQLIQSATGGMVPLGNEALANQDTAGALTSAGDYTVDQPTVEQPQVVATVAPAWNIMTFQETAVGYNGAFLTLEKDSVLIVVRPEEVPSPSICGWDLGELDASGVPTWALACPAPGSGRVRTSELKLPDGLPMPPADATATPPPSEAEQIQQLAETNKAIAQCWIKFAGDNNLSKVTQGLGTSVVPGMTHWVVEGPSGWTDFWSDSLWYISSSELGVPAYQITESLAKSLGGQSDKSVQFIGTGSMCMAP